MQSRPRTKIYLESRYRKLVRDLPQTIFYCPDCKGDRRRRADCKRCAGRGKLTPDSVQELIGCQLLPAYRARTGKFHGAGREDVDVRMLGRGRPFVYEVVAPRNLAVDLEQMRNRILELHGDRIQLDPFVPVTKARIAYWKERKLDKVYAAVVQAEVEVGAEKLGGLIDRDVTIAQRTPERVAHRRADLERERHVRILAARPAAERQFEVELRCEHGTYVKEWISGEDGRTRPSLPDLVGVPCRCLQLDVLEIVG
jgi:tRNA pseudouridine synthase 10